MPSRWDSATRGWRRRVFHYPPPTLMSRNFRLPCAIELKPLSLTPLKMRKVELSIRLAYGSVANWEPYHDGIGAVPRAQPNRLVVFRNGDGWFIYNLTCNLAAP